MAVLVVTALLYVPLAWAEFAWDDEALVVGNHVTGSLAHLGAWFSSDLWMTSAEPVVSGYYRPLMLASLWLDRLLWADSAAGHHLQNVAWHLLAVGALWAWLRRVVPGGAAVGAALFALHPVQTEAVAWVVARNDLMAAAFGFVGLAALAPRSVGSVRLVVGALALAAACLSKEHAALLILAVPLVDLARFGRPGDLRRWVAGLLAVAAFLALRSAAGVAAGDLPVLAGLAVVDGRPLALPTWVAGRVMWPWPLSVGGTLEYLEPSLGLSARALGAAALAGGLVVWRGGRTAAVGFLLAGATFAPALLPLLTRGQLGERYFYLPLMGVALAVAAAAPSRPSRAFSASALLVAGLMAAGVRARVPDWSSGLALWQAAVRDTPNGHAHANLGFELLRLGDGEAAAAWLGEALMDEPPFRDACVPLVLGSLKQGRVGVAAERAAFARTRGCFSVSGFPGVYASAMAQTGRWSLAEEAVALAASTDARAGVVDAALAVRTRDTARLQAVADRFGLAPAALEGTARQVLAASGWTEVEELQEEAQQ